MLFVATLIHPANQMNHTNATLDDSITSAALLDMVDDAIQQQVRTTSHLKEAMQYSCWLSIYYTPCSPYFAPPRCLV